MNHLWKWVAKLDDDLNEAGQGASARMLSQFTDHVCDFEIERAEALVPEAKALAKSLSNPWLEVFVGHWEMRNRIGNKMEGETALADTVALFERAHRADAIDCPQSVCVTQDLSACYANIDGPGWATERREIAEETLRRIDPSWNCYICLSSEYASALYDEGRHEEVLSYLDARVAELEAAGIEDIESIHDTRYDSMLKLGRADEVLRGLEAAEAAIDYVESEQCRLPRLLRKTLALAMLERDDEAWELLPQWSDMAPQCYPKWIACVDLLLQRAPERNTWQLGSRLQEALDHCAQVGAHRPLIDNAAIAIRLALARGAVWNARRILKLARRHLPLLRGDHGARALLDRLEQAIDSKSADTRLPVAAEQLVDWLVQRGEQGHARNPEEEVEWVLQALTQRPEDQDLLLLAVSAQQACAAHIDAQALLWNYVERHTAQADSISAALLDSLLQQGQGQQVERLASLFEQGSPVFAAWCRAKLAAQEKNWNAANTACEAILSIDPQMVGAHHLKALALRQQKQFSAAATAYQGLIDLLEEPRPALWDHMTAASAVGDWDAVRRSAKRLEMELTGESGPIQEEWHWVIIRFHDDGDTFDYYAQRTGPVTARIVENAVPGKTQHVLDEIVFDATFLETPPEDEEARKDFVYTYEAVHVMSSGEHARSWAVEGVDPGEERFERLRADLIARACQVWVYRSGYALTSEEDEALTGVLFTIAAPIARPAIELHTMLEELTADLKHPMAWPSLAEQCSANPEIHRARLERYGL